MNSIVIKSSFLNKELNNRLYIQAQEINGEAIITIRDTVCADPVTESLNENKTIVILEKGHYNG